jgi:hypothetical protein
MAHSTHVKGIGTFDGGIERPRIQVTLATGIEEAECHAINLGYRDPRTIDPSEWIGRPGRLHVPRAGETLFRLKTGAPSFVRPDSRPEVSLAPGAAK